MKHLKLALCLLLFISHLGVSQTNCALKIDDNDISVYLCDSRIGKFKTIVVELDVPATVSQYAAIVLDVERYHEWQYKAVNPRLVERVSETELYYYSEVQTPWPTSNRDMIWHIKITQDTLTKVMVSEQTIFPDYLPKVDGVVRIPEARATLTVTPIDKTHVHVHYILDVDPGGAVPAWIANIFAAQAPWHTYNNFVQLVIAQGDNRISVPFIEDY